jgi:4-hydroxybenzoate polyprenyltransferase
LVQRFSQEGFDYAGNDRADLAVWREADGILIVNASKAVSNQASAIRPVVTEFSNRPELLLTALRAMRPNQWLKNLLVFAPLLTSRSIDDVSGVLHALCAFISFCAVASGVYLINDLMDLKADRYHPRKRLRPLPSGALPLTFGALLAGVLAVVGVTLAAAVEISWLILIYLAASLSYSLGVKRYPLLDVFTLAGLYTLRIVAGGVASGHAVTFWLLAFSGFIFLSLALIKRVAEMMEVEVSLEIRQKTGRGYYPEDRPVLVVFGCAAAFASSVVLALFVSTSAAVQPYRTPELLWTLVPLFLFWQCRLWLSTTRGLMHDDPIVYASQDWVSWLFAVSVIIVTLLAGWGTVLP